MRQGAKVTVFFGSRGVNAIHKDKLATLTWPARSMSERDLIDGAKLAEPARYYKEVVMRADMNLTF